MTKMKIRPYNKLYSAYRGKPQWKGSVRIAAAAAAVLLLLLVAAAIVFRRELAVAGTIRPLDQGLPAYFMEVKGDYYFEEFLAQGGASSDGEVSAFLSGKISKGFYRVPVEAGRKGCSVLSVWNEGSIHLWGRNYDWTGSVPVIVRHIPEEGYASLSTCDFQNITGSAEALPEGMVNKLLAIAALYVPLDGVNDAGLCVADLEVNEGGMPDPDTEKPDLTITTAIRLLLDKAASVDEALDLLRQYDIHPSGGISHHLAVSDAKGNSVVVEFTRTGFTAVPAEAVTNFNMLAGDTAAGGESARKCYEILTARLEQGVITNTEQVRDAMQEVSQTDSTWTTQWSIVYDQSHPYVTWYFGGDFTQGGSLSILP
ncbi:MAG: linear amide C-N hydrolase [Oscillospiraceae bacterium]|nr:linear amide C-N hydrolase [Oscillospiraceae bacterium]